MRLFLFLLYLTGLAALKYSGLEIHFGLYCVRCLLSILIATNLLSLIWVTMCTSDCRATIGDLMGDLPESNEWHHLVSVSLVKYFGTKVGINIPRLFSIKGSNNSVHTPMVGSRGYTTRKRSIHSFSARRFSNTTGIITKTSLLAPVTSRALQLGGLRPIGPVKDLKTFNVGKDKSLEYSGVRALSRVSGELHQQGSANLISSMSFREPDKLRYCSGAFTTYRKEGNYLEPFWNSFGMGEAVRAHFKDKGVLVSLPEYQKVPGCDHAAVAFCPKKSEVHFFDGAVLRSLSQTAKDREVRIAHPSGNMHGSARYIVDKLHHTSAEQKDWQDEIFRLYSHPGKIWYLPGKKEIVTPEEAYRLLFTLGGSGLSRKDVEDLNDKFIGYALHHQGVTPLRSPFVDLRGLPDKNVGSFLRNAETYKEKSCPDGLDFQGVFAIVNPKGTLTENLFSEKSLKPINTWVASGSEPLPFRPFKAKLGTYLGAKPEDTPFGVISSEEFGILTADTLDWDVDFSNLKSD